jgi:hypothetical protein
MARIVGIHGIGQQYSSRDELEKEWRPALRGGLRAAERQGLARQGVADAMSDEDLLRVAFFGDFFRRLGELGHFPPYQFADLTSEEVALLTTLYEAVAVEPRLGGDTTGALGPPPSVQVMAERLLRSPIFAGLVERTLVGNFKQVTQFLSNDAIKEDVLNLVNKEIDDSTRVLIGHSLGSVVAYEYLCQYQPPGIELFVTLGSPLGIPNVIFNKLTPKPVPVGGAKPSAVKRWVNKVFFNGHSPTPDPFAGV